MITQQQTQRQQLKILPQQIQLLNLFFLNTLELEQRINTELDENLFLEQETDTKNDEDLVSKEQLKDDIDWDEYLSDDKPDYKTEYQNYFNDEQTPEIPLKQVVHFKDDLKQQLRMLDITEREKSISLYIIDLLNANGMIDRPIDDIIDDLSFQFHEMIEAPEVGKAIDRLQTLEPIGIASRSVQECLRLQLESMNTKRADVKCAIELIKNHYENLIHRQFEKIYHQLHIDEEELRMVLSLIGKLNFYPVTEVVANEPKNTIIPDYIITREGDNIFINLFSSKKNNVFVNQSLYDQLAQQVSNRDRGANQYIKSKLQSAQWFVNAVKQREETMMHIMQAIVVMQHEYFMDGDISCLKPMVLRNIAEQIGMDISTISRITSNKYADTHFGIVYLKDLFSEGIADRHGVVISNKVIQVAIQEAIDAEDKHQPYTDQQLVNILESKGYNIARRTVAKYREQMHIPIAQIRAVWA